MYYIFRNVLVFVQNRHRLSHKRTALVKLRSYAKDNLLQFVLIDNIDKCIIIQIAS